MIARWLSNCERLLLARPWHSLLVLLALMLIVGARSGDLRLAVVPDAQLRRAALERSDGQAGLHLPARDALVVSYRPRGEDLMSERSLERIARLRDALAGVAGVRAVESFLEVPLLFSPPIRLVDLGGDLQQLRDTGVDTDLARAEFLHSPLYRQSLLGRDGQLTALRLTLEADATQALARGDARLLARLDAVLAAHREEAEIFLGGVPLIAAAAMPAAVQRDLLHHAVPALGAMALALAVLWRRARWALVPPAAAAACAMLMLGVLGWSGQPLAAVALYALPLAMAAAAGMAIRLALRMRARCDAFPAHGPRALVREAMRDALLPLLGAAGVAVAACAALAASELVVVAAFGRVAALGVVLATLLACTLVPVLFLLGVARQPRAAPLSLVAAAGGLVQRFGITLVLLALALLVAGLGGIGQLRPEERVLERFAASDAFRRGLQDIDREFGGLAKLSIVLEADAAAAAGAGTANPWYSAQGLKRLAEVQDRLGALEGVASVRSLALFGATVAELAGGPVDDARLAAAWRGMPAARRARLLEPWLEPATRQTLVEVGLSDIGPSPPRAELAGHIRGVLVDELGFAPEQLRIDGAPLGERAARQALWRTGLFGMGAASLALALLVLAWCRGAALAALVTVPGLLAGGAVLGAMGWLGVPLGTASVMFGALVVTVCAGDCIDYLWRSRPGGVGAARAGTQRAWLAILGVAACRAFALGTAFAMLLPADFRPGAQLGMMGALGLCAAVLAAVLLPPVVRLGERLGAALPAAPGEPLHHDNCLRRA